MEKSKIKKIIKEELKSILNESSLSRLWQHNHNHDCGAISAFRLYKDCGKGERLTRKDNSRRNKLLAAMLLSKGYGITKIMGKYPEGGENSKEMGFWVVDLKDKGNLEQVLRKVGEIFQQDSILFAPRGSIDNTTKAFLVGTNQCPNNWIGYGQKSYFSKAQMGVESPIYTSYVNGRPFVFKECKEEVLGPGDGKGWWYLNLLAEKGFRGEIDA